MILALASLAQPLCAVNPLRKPIRIEQGDGSFIQVYKKGNGHFAFLATKDGVAVMRGEDRSLYYAALTAEGDLVATNRLAHEADRRSPEELSYVRAQGVTEARAYAALRERHVVSSTLGVNSSTLGVVSSTLGVKSATPSDGLGRYGETSPGLVPSIGSPRIPLIMVQFPDRKFQSTTTQEKVSRSRNEAGYSDEKGCVGSVRDYFIAQSDGMFSPTFDVAAVVTVSKEYAYYGKNSGTRVDVKCLDLVKEAVSLAKQQGVDFSQFAIDGQIPLVSILYAGPGEHESEEDGFEDYIWAHYLGNINIPVDNMRIRSYFVGNEVTSAYSYPSGKPVVTKETFSGIGVFCHEFGHALGLPDFYDTTGRTDQKTPDLWSVMDYGQYYADGYAPIGYTAYEKAFMGWLDVADLDDTPAYCRLYPYGSDKGPTAYRIINPANPKEYFLLEYRQPGTWYPSRMGQGMLITHVDYNASSWDANTLNNDAKRLRFTVVPADNKWQFYNIYSTDWFAFSGDLFPRSALKTEFSDTSIPASTVYTGKKLGRPIYNITDAEDRMEFSYLDATLTGIESVATEAGDKVDVYGFDGRLVVRGAARETLQNVLEPGIYILKSGAHTRKVQIR